MRKTLSIIALATVLSMTSCKMENPFLSESNLPYGAPDFSKIKTEHYVPAFEAGVAEMKANIDAIIACEDEPTFENTILAMEYANPILNRVEGIFFNLKEADTNDDIERIAEEITPMLTEASMYVSLNEKLFEKVKYVWENREKYSLGQEEYQLLKKSYEGFARNGANLPADKKAEYAKLSEELSLKQLEFSKNALNATKAYVLNVTDESRLAGLPGFALAEAKETAAAKGLEGWAFTLDYSSYSSFMKYAEDRDLRKELWMARSTSATTGEFDNTQVVKDIVDYRIKIANILGYETFADYALENRMAKSTATVMDFLKKLTEPTIPAAKKEVAEVLAYAKANGYEGSALEPWDFSFWSDKYQTEKYAINDNLLKPYLKLEDCIDAVFMLAGKLYGLTFEPIDLPVYHKDVKVFDVKDENGVHKALFYADFFPRDSKRSGAWMTEFAGQRIENGVEHRPFISIVTNFTKPTAEEPSLLTHYEFTTFLHEFGHALHGMLAEGKYEGLTGTNVARDFVELPSQIMENWGYEPEYLNLFAKHYKTGEKMPQDYIEKIKASKNYLSAYMQLNQLRYGTIDMAWYTLKSVPETDAVTFEKEAVKKLSVLPSYPGTCSSPTFGHIFSGGYAAGYYSYKWAEVLEADAFALFEEKGIFNREVSDSFRKEILSRGSIEDADVLYRNFRGHDPQPEALLRKLDIIK